MPSKSEHVSVIVYILVILFGIASWVDINGLWVELPILVQELPEGWSLPSYMVMLIQVANISPFIYTLTSVRCPHRLPEKLVIYSIIGVGVSACVLLVFFWNTTTLIGGEPHSTALFILNFFLALVDTTSSVAFLPFMAIFKPAYMTAYFIGEGFSALLPGLLGLAQGTGRVVCRNVTENSTVTLNGTTFVVIKQSLKQTYIDINFSIEAFFIFIGCMVLVSGISFTLLNYHSRCKQEYDVRSFARVIKRKVVVESVCPLVQPDKGLQTDDCHIETLCGATSNENDCEMIGNVGHTSDVSESQMTKMARGDYISSLVITAWVNALTNAVLVSVQSYSCLPYGTKPYHLTATMVNVANPLASFLPFFIYITSVPALCGLTVVGSLIGAYIMAAATMSPEPVLVGTEAGGALMVTAWVTTVFLLTYVKVCLATLLRTEGKRGLLYCGAAQQVGSVVGGVVMFLLVSVFDLFVMVKPCT